mmetsp:Transcript_35577/g.81541  ORF Transcript_35577/g.81541 Transcript_35577/m.81541 type:complete len:100 (+) Transcript_35577:658-957(+)
MCGLSLCQSEGYDAGQPCPQRICSAAAGARKRRSFGSLSRACSRAVPRCHAGSSDVHGHGKSPQLRAEAIVRKQVAFNHWKVDEQEELSRQKVMSPVSL